MRIIAGVQTLDEQMFYVVRAANAFWGRENLINALRNNLYHQQGSMPSNFALTIPNEEQRAVAMKTFKEDNVLDFLTIPNPDHIDEHDVEQQIVENVKNFMMSLGGEFEPEYAGKLNYYLSALDTLVKLPEENPSIGILLCRSKDNMEVEFALRDINKPMGVATYRTTSELPELYRNSLPSVEDLKRLM